MRPVAFIRTLALTAAFAQPLEAQSPGSIDPTFTGTISGSDGWSGSPVVYHTVVQLDGSILVAGRFTTVNGEPRPVMARLDASGALDRTFTPLFTTAVTSPPTPPPSVHALALQADGKIIVGGNFYRVTYEPRRFVARLNAGGDVDTDFLADTNDPNIFHIAVKPNGKALLAGEFTTVNGQPRNRLARVDLQGVLDTFNPDIGPAPHGFFLSVWSVATQEDGQMVIGGYFSTVGGVPRDNIARLNADGTLEENFNPTVAGFYPRVLKLLVQPDGKILLGGGFETVNGMARNRIARLNSDGSLDTVFDPNLVGSHVIDMALQANGKILITGYFTSVGGQPRDGIARLNPDGSLDPAFDQGPGVNGGSCVEIQGDGKVLVGGVGLTRLLNDEAIQLLTIPSNTRVQWLRDGAAPEIEQVTFELSTDAGWNWSALGPGSRAAGRWECTGLSLPGSGAIRARGRTLGGSFIEQTATFGAGTPLPQWKLAALGNANAPNDGDNDSDGLRTLVEYATGSHPLSSSAPPTVRTIANRLTLTFPRNSTATDVALTVQGSDDLSTWTNLARSTDGGAMVPLVAGVSVAETGTSVLRTVEIRDLYLTTDSAHPRRFLRLHAAPQSAGALPHVLRHRHRRSSR